MVIEKLRQKAQREAAEKRAQEASAAARRRKRRVTLVSPALASHAIFRPTLILWGAALGGLSVLALSSVTIARASMFAGLGVLGSSAQYLFAALAAALGALVGLAIARVMRSWARGSRRSGPMVTMAGRRVRPIDPATELGSDSLDAPLKDPINEMPPVADLDAEVPPGLYDTDAEEPLELEAANEIWGDIGDEDPIAQATLRDDNMVEDDILALETPLDEESDLSAMIEAVTDREEDEPLDLGAFDAVDEASESNPETQADTEALAGTDAGTDAEIDAENGTASVVYENTAPRTGIEKLRQTAPEDLSLVQLVERFAVALHDAQDRPARDFTAAPGLQGTAERERALAEALKALALFSERGFDQQTQVSTGMASKPRRFGASFGGQATVNNASAIGETERQLREALAKLQNLRGAA